MVSLALVRAHELIALDLSKEDQVAYWRNEKVWSNIRSSFERFFELDPKDVSCRYNDALFVRPASDWDELNQ